MALRRKESKEEIMADLAKLQGMVDRAKQTSGMQTLAALWTSMLKGKVAGMVLRWNQNACGPKDLDMPAEEEEEAAAESPASDAGVETGYSCELGANAPPTETEAVEETEDYSCDVLAPAPEQAPQRMTPEDETAASSPASIDGRNPMAEYVDDMQAAGEASKAAPAVKKSVPQE